MSALGLGTQFGVLLPYSRKQESEADLIGVHLMAQAGFDPRESISLWKNMEAYSPNEPPEFMSTHPSSGTRIERLQAAIPGILQQDYERAASHPRPCPRPSDPVIAAALAGASYSRR
jgi:predicted Zn-dependent protease